MRMASKKSPKVVIDTNVLIPAFIAHGASEIVWAYAIEGLIEACLSDFILKEFKRNMKNKFNLSKPELIISHIKSVVRIIEVNKNNLPKKVVVTKDPDDDNIFACAIACDADFIVTGDKELLKLENYEKTRIFSPRNLINLLDKI